MPSSSLTIDDILGLASRIATAFDSGVEGVIVVQGTDTIEETAYLLDVMNPGSKPIVVTGAMRDPTVLGADGPANLAAALAVARSKSAHGLGCLVVFSGDVHYARDVCKAHTVDVRAFASPNLGPVGAVVEKEVRLWPRQLPRQFVAVTRVTRPAKVGLATMVLDDDGGWIRLARHQYDGLVIAGLGGGHVPNWLVEDLATIAGAMPVVLCSRVFGGPVLTRTYGYPGSETDLVARGLINSGYLQPIKARLLLTLLLSSGATTADIKKAFSESWGTFAQAAL
jgi:L-asparaginase